MYPSEMIRLIKELKKSFIPSEQTELMREYILERWNNSIMESRCFMGMKKAKDPDWKYNIDLSRVGKVERISKAVRLWYQKEEEAEAIEPKDVEEDFERLARLLKRFALIRVGEDLLIHIDNIVQWRDETREIHLNNNEIIILDEEAFEVFEKNMDLWDAMNTDDPDAEDYGFDDSDDE
jgi:hypothetical protein